MYPAWAQAFGLCLAMSSMLCIPIYATFKLFSSPGSSILEVKFGTLNNMFIYVFALAKTYFIYLVFIVLLFNLSLIITMS